MEDLPLTNYQAISVHQDNISSIHGIFAFLQELNGKYSSRYEIEANPLNEGDVGKIIDNYYSEQNIPYRSQEGKNEITFRFKSPLLLTGYAIGNSTPDSSNSYPEAWNIIGIDDSKNRYIIDTQTEQKFCYNNLTYCPTEIIKGYKISKRVRGFKEFVFQQTKNSDHHSYVLLRAIDFFGTLCGINKSCSFSFYSCIVRTSNLRSPVIITIYLLTL